MLHHVAIRHRGLAMPLRVGSIHHDLFSGSQSRRQDPWLGGPDPLWFSALSTPKAGSTVLKTKARRDPLAFDKLPVDSDAFMNAAFPERLWEAKANAFFVRNPVFRLEEFVDAYTSTEHSRHAARKALQYYVRAGRLEGVLRGVYAVADVTVDSLLLASRITSRAVLAYGTALWFHRAVVGVDRCAILSRAPRRGTQSFTHRGFEYRIVAPPKALVSAGKAELGIGTATYEGQRVEVTSLERTFADCLDRLQLGPGIDETFQAFNSTDSELNAHAIADHVERLQSRICAARVGMMLQTHPKYRSQRDVLRRLQQLRPKSPAAVIPGDPDTWFVSNWNVMLPRSIYNRMVATCGPFWARERF
jgi:predicted transcriptional regulator of viral defense system